ncbi:LysR family transcriptional regulator [Sporosarcina thermotolerans]|uniref:LysR family transcriptional regulator n=1 Tax=Sporosarcina thermotolerans TaxID=633404 RepID=A0AAW9A5S0_9BACL|nr:LysR family transcriptional regulator [Sporosarcina thermotolerans]MDW0116552.1 LysR family transcriptional regulator [Sporosarcina thermotolerans]WHT48771.1 LysR family transcriptional regulator [Sporosarcina thermotolerans]
MVSKLDLYRIFCVVGRNESFSGAAKELFMTQPAISQSIMQLEKELDTRLFNRTPKGVTPTNEGSLLLEYVNSAINLIEIGEEKIAEFKNLTIGELRIGVGDTISKYFLLPQLEAFRNRYPSLKLKIENGTTDTLISLLKSGEVDIVVCNLPVDDDALNVRSCMDIHDTFVYGDKYRKLLARPIGFQELVKLPLIFLEPSSNSRKYVEDFLLSKGVKISPEFELGSHDLVVEFARINMGIACVTREFTEDYLESGMLQEVQLKEQIPHRSIGVCSLKSVPLSPASTRFLELLVPE